MIVIHYFTHFQDCQDVVAAVCSPGAVGPESVLSCLMHQVAVQSRQMTKDCRERLMEIQFFMARDFSLDPKLYKQCRRDAQDLCQADEHWYSNPNQGTVDYFASFQAKNYHISSYLLSISSKSRQIVCKRCMQTCQISCLAEFQAKLAKSLAKISKFHEKVAKCQIKIQAKVAKFPAK